MSNNGFIANPVIFLDIDGVLNSAQMDWSKFQMQPELVARMNELVRRTGAMVVLSSTWRSAPNWREMTQEHGLDFEFLDRTPRLNGKPRGAEIYSWLSKNRDIKNYAIIDDDGDMLALQKPHFFQTSWELGLTQEIADAVYKYLCPHASATL